MCEAADGEKTWPLSSRKSGVFSLSSRGPNLMEVCLLSPPWVPGICLPPHIIPQVKVPGFGARPGGAAGRSWRSSASHSAQGHGRPLPRGGVRDQSSGFGEPERAPHSCLLPLAPAPGRSCSPAVRPFPPVGPADGRYSRREAALRRARRDGGNGGLDGLGGRGGVRGAPRGCAVLPARPVPARPRSH